MSITMKSIEHGIFQGPLIDNRVVVNLQVVLMPYPFISV